MAKGSADRAAIADRAIGNVAGDAPHSAARNVRNASSLDVGVRNARPENELIAATLDLPEFGKTRDVDDQLRLYQPQIEHRTQRLAAGDDPGGCFGRTEDGKRCLQIAWAFIAERSRLHAACLSASRPARIASTIQ